MKIIAFYVGQYPEGFSPMSRRLHYYMKALHQKGVIVEIVMPSPHLKENGVYDGIKELLEALKKDGRILAVATSKPEVIK